MCANRSRNRVFDCPRKYRIALFHSWRLRLPCRSVSRHQTVGFCSSHETANREPSLVANPPLENRVLRSLKGRSVGLA